MENKTSNTLFDTADEIYFKPIEGESSYELDVEEDIRNRLVGLIEDRFAEAENARDVDEQRWLKAYHNFRGLYGRGVKFRESEKSKVFVKVTKTKVLAAFGQLVDVIFGTGQFPIGITETKLPEGLHTDSKKSSEKSKNHFQFVKKTGRSFRCKLVRHKSLALGPRFGKTTPCKHKNCE